MWCSYGKSNHCDGKKVVSRKSSIDRILNQSVFLKSTNLNEIQNRENQTLFEVKFLLKIS